MQDVEVRARDDALQELLVRADERRADRTRRKIQRDGAKADGAAGVVRRLIPRPRRGRAPSLDGADGQRDEAGRGQARHQHIER